MSRCFETVIPQPTKILGQICLQHNVALKILNRMMLSDLNTNDKGVFLLCKQKSHCFGTALSVVQAKWLMNLSKTRLE